MRDKDMTTPTRRHPLRLRWLAGCAIAAAAIALSLLLTQRNAAPLVRQQMEAIPVLIPTPIPTPNPTLPHNNTKVFAHQFQSCPKVI